MKWFGPDWDAPDVNAIPRELFIPFEDALREWAVSYVRAALEVSS